MKDDLRIMISAVMFVVLNEVLHFPHIDCFEETLNYPCIMKFISYLILN